MAAIAAGSGLNDLYRGGTSNPSVRTICCAIPATEPLDVPIKVLGRETDPASDAVSETAFRLS
jgi:hypothetical protein